MKRIAIYGKGGIGKSTIVSNLAAVLATQGKRVLAIGCDPKADSTRNLVGKRIATVLDVFQAKGKHAIALEDILVRGYQGTYCIESGGPEPGIGCAGRGITTTMDILRHLRVFEELAPDIVLFDVLGDVVCGGFAMPLQKQWVEQVFIVTTADPMALYAANNICKGMARYTEKNGITLGGFIHNGRSVCDNVKTVERFADKLGGRVIGHIPMSLQISRAEMQRKTVIEYDADCQVSRQFQALAQELYTGNGGHHTLRPYDDAEFDAFISALCW
jgi:nitrogenase iron protein NifH